jgi:hypothetical protein
MIKLQTILSEDLRAWFGKGEAGGVGGGGWDRYNSSGDRVGKCGDAKEGDAYAACLSKEKARKLGKDGRAAFVKRKRAAQKKGGDAKKGGERSKGQKPIKVKTESTNMNNSNNFLQHFQSQTGITGDFKYIGSKNNERIYTMPLNDLGAMKLIISDAIIMARVSENYAYFGIIYTLTGLEQFDATILLLKMQDGKIESKQFDENDPDFSDSKTKFASLIKLMVEKQNSIKVSNEEITPEQSEKIGMPFKDTEKSAPYGSGYTKIKELEEKLNLFLEKNIPTDPDKWDYYKSRAEKKFDVYPSAYANAWASKMYKKAGGGWRKG